MKSVVPSTQHGLLSGASAGDFKPLNCVRVSAENAADVNGHPAPEWKVIDLDAASPIGKGFLGLKASTVYSPPELVYRAASAGTAPEKGGGSGDGVGGAGPAGVEQLPWLAGGGGFRVRGVDERGVAVDPGQKGQFEPLVAHPSYDVWCAPLPPPFALRHYQRILHLSTSAYNFSTAASDCLRTYTARSFGCVLFEMLMRETLWHGNTDGNLSRAGARECHYLRTPPCSLHVLLRVFIGLLFLQPANSANVSWVSRSALPPPTPPSPHPLVPV